MAAGERLRADLDELYDLHDVVRQRVAAGTLAARPALKALADMIVERERKLADAVDRAAWAEDEEHQSADEITFPGKD
jgi:hypothetical protein